MTRRRDPLASVNRAVAALGKALPALIEAADDPAGEGLASLLLEAREARTALYELEQRLESEAARAMMGDDLDGSGVRAERYRARDRKAWDHESWQRDVRMKALRRHGALKGAQLVTAEGEVLPVSLHALLSDVQAAHGAAAPKSTTLRALGLDVGDYCETTPGAWHVRVFRKA